MPERAGERRLRAPPTGGRGLFIYAYAVGVRKKQEAVDQKVERPKCKTNTSCVFRNNHFFLCGFDR